MIAKSHIRQQRLKTLPPKKSEKPAQKKRKLPSNTSSEDAKVPKIEPLTPGSPRGVTVRVLLLPIFSISF